MITDIAFVVPDHKVDVEEVSKWTDSDPQFIRDKVGIESRYFLREDEAPSVLAAKAVFALQEKAGFNNGDIDFLILVTQTPDYSIPHMSAQVQNLCNLPQSIMAFDVSLGCSGYVYALSIAKGLLSSVHSKGLIVTCDPYSKVMAREDKATVTVFGDGASCSLVTANNLESICEFDFGTDGSGGDKLILKHGAGKQPMSSIWSQSPKIDSEDTKLYMHGRSILNFMLERIPVSVNTCLEKNNLLTEDIDYFVFHQASKYMLELLSKRMGLEPERVPIRLQNTGNTVSSTIPYCLECLDNEGILKGKKVLISGFGVGLSWATTVIDF